MRYYSMFVVAVFWLVDQQALALDAVYYSETGFGDTVSQLTIDPTVAEGAKTDVVTIRNRDPRGLAVDEINGHIYYADGFNISRSNLNGTNPTTLISLGVTPGDIEVDPVGQKLYYSTLFNTDAGVFSADLDGTGVATVQNAATLLANMAPANVTTKDVYNISIDTDAGRLYWTADNGSVAGRIGLNSTPLDGGAVVQHWVGASRLDSISKMEINFETSKLYYTVGSETNAVFRSNLDNGSLETLVSGIGRPGAIALDTDNDRLYFAVGGKVYERELDGTAVADKTISLSTLFSIADMQIASTTAIPEPATALVALLSFAALVSVFRRQ